MEIVPSALYIAPKWLKMKAGKSLRISEIYAMRQTMVRFDQEMADQSGCSDTRKNRPSAIDDLLTVVIIFNNQKE